MLEHIGRESGNKRYVVLEIIDHPAAKRYVVVSGFGSHAQWFRNVEATPQVRIRLGVLTTDVVDGASVLDGVRTSE